MAEREKIIRYYRASGNGELAARLLDLAEGTLKSNKYKTSEFLDPYAYSIAETIVAHYPRLLLNSEGGYEGSERVKVAFVSEDFKGTPDFMISVVRITWDGRYYHITHRDVLGALLGLGVKREVLGDIVMQGDSCYCIIECGFEKFMLEQLVKVGPAVVSVEKSELAQIPQKELKIKEIKATVASLRLDVIAAAGFGVSRSRMAEEISAEKVKVNWQDCKSSAQAIKVGDIISMRGRGRVEVCEILGQTKKGRTSIFLKRFI